MEEVLKALIASINGLAVSMDELATEIQETRESIGDLQKTIETTEFIN